MVLDDVVQSKLRANSIISESEVALKLGDLFVAENVLSKDRRQLTASDVSRFTSVVNESAAKKGLLKD